MCNKHKSMIHSSNSYGNLSFLFPFAGSGHCCYVFF